MTERKASKLLLEKSGPLVQFQGTLARSESRQREEESTPLLGVLFWRRRWIVAASVGVCVTLAAVYLLLTPRLYRAQAQLEVQQNTTKVFADNLAPTPQSDTFLSTQAQAIMSAPVIRAALNKIDYRQLKMFAHATGDPADAVRQSGMLSVEPGKKDDTLTVSVDSPYRDEATLLAGAVVDAYVARLSEHRQHAGQEMVRILNAQRDQIEQKLQAGMAELVKFKATNGAVSFRDEKGNTTLDRLATLSTALNAAELNTLDAKVQLESTEAVLKTPKDIAAYVESQQMKGRDFGDREFDDLRSQLAQTQLQYRSALEVIGPNNLRAREIKATLDLLTQKIADKEKAIAEAQVSQLNVTLAAAQQRENTTRELLEKQRAAAITLNPLATQYSKLETDVDRMQKQVDVLDSRIQQVTVDDVAANTLDVDIIDPAHGLERAVKPNKPLTMAVALLAGLMIGGGIIGAAEWRNKPLRTPEDITGQLDLPMVGAVPRMGMTLSSAERGQLANDDALSEVAEAYRSIRTTIAFGAPEDSKTLLVTSPTSGEGKSTCASNLAISLAQNGHRTLVIDADMRRPVQHKIFETENGIGLSDVMLGKGRLRDAIRATGVHNLFVLPCGSIPGKPAEMLQSQRFSELMKLLRGMFDRVVIDSPPVIPVTDARILASSSDITLLVLRMKRSSRHLGASAVDMLKKVKANVLGAIANEVELGEEYGYYGQRSSQKDYRRAGSLRRIFSEATGIALHDRTAKSGALIRKSGQSRPAHVVVATQLPADLMEISDPEAPADVRWAESASW